MITTRTGKRVSLVDPNYRDIDMEDIAHALSMQCRFNGHTKEFYSVAQHSCLVSHYVGEMGGTRREQFAALMHDAHEAYMGDIFGPMKEFGSIERDLHYIERQLDDAIATRFNIVMDAELRKLIKHADMTLLVTEARDLLEADTSDWFRGYRRWDWEIQAQSQPDAKLAFLERARSLTNPPEVAFA